MTLPRNEPVLDKPIRPKKKRSAVFIVIIVSVFVHLLAGLGLATVKIIEVLQPTAEFEAPPIVAVEAPPPPPPPPPTIQRTQRSLPRPQPLAVQNPQNMSVPSIEISQSDLSIGAGRGFGGGLGALGGGVADSIRITSFGFDRALEGTLQGSLYDLKKDEKGDRISIADERESEKKVIYAAEITQNFVRNFDLNKLDGKFYKSVKSLYASYFIIPDQAADVAPRSFAVESEVEPSLIAVVYTGTYKPEESGRFRFLGRGDDVMFVRINGKLVLDASWRADVYSRWRPSATAKKANEETKDVYFGISKPILTGDWFDLRAGYETEVEVFISEVPGGRFGAYLLIEKQGGSGPQIFSTRPLSAEDKTFLKNSHPDAAQFIGEAN